jgi:hypothetical protein
MEGKMKKLFHLVITLVFLMVLATTASLVWANGGLVSYWPLDGTANDAVNGNHGTNYGADYVAGKYGQALYFDGSDYVEVPDDDSLEPVDTISVLAWVKRLGSPGGAKYIVSKYLPEHHGSHSSYGLYSGSGGLRFYVGRTTGSWIGSPQATAGAVWDGEWHHAVGTFDGSELKLYLDGVQVDGAVSYLNDIYYSGTGNLYIGSYYDGSWLAFSGTIDEVCIFNRAINQVEAKLFAGGLLCNGAAGISLGPDGAINPMNSTHTVTATIDPAIADIPVAFVVSGANSTSGSDITGDNQDDDGDPVTEGTGVATFDYDGTVAGVDTITACIDLDGEVDCDVGEPQISVTKYWPDVISITQNGGTDDAINPIGATHEVEVTVNASGAPVPGASVLLMSDSTVEGSGTTDSTGTVTIGYSSGEAGTHILTACLDFGEDGLCDGSDLVSNALTKHWVDRYVTGGGNYKFDRTVHWSFAGTVGLNDSSGLVGNFQVQDHTANSKWHFSQIIWLFFPDNQTAMFEAKTADGTSAIFTIQDLGEPGKNVDTIEINGSSDPDLNQVTITGGNFQVRLGPVPGVVTRSIEEGWDVCGQGGSGMVTLIPFASGIRIILEMTGLPPSTSYDLYLTDFNSHDAFGSLADPWFGKGPNTYTRTDCNTSITGGPATRTAFVLDDNLLSSGVGSISEMYHLTGVAAGIYEIQLGMTLNMQGAAQFRTGDTYADTVTVVIP